MSMTQKAQYLAQVQVAMTELGQLADRAKTLVEMCADRGYDGSEKAANTTRDYKGAPEADAVTDHDLAVCGVVADEFAVAIDVLREITKLMNGEATEPNKAYRAVVNRWRRI